MSNEFWISVIGGPIFGIFLYVVFIRPWLFPKRKKTAYVIYRQVFESTEKYIVYRKTTRFKQEYIGHGTTLFEAERLTGMRTSMTWGMDNEIIYKK
jgi:hypothetical protein